MDEIRVRDDKKVTVRTVDLFGIQGLKKSGNRKDTRREVRGKRRSLREMEGKVVGIVE